MNSWILLALTKISKCSNKCIAHCYVS